MLVRLTSSTSGEMIMLAKHAHELFKWMDKECVAHGIFTADQLPAAIDRLCRGIGEEKQAVREKEQEKRNQENQENDGKDKEKESFLDEPVPLGKRAQPLVHLMEKTLKENGFIIWKAATDF